jgi:hypothetical protein
VNDFDVVLGYSDIPHLTAPVVPAVFVCAVNDLAGEYRLKFCARKVGVHFLTL